ncbi:MAG: lipopolysaccharide biosynthesis protein [Clostridiales bacterium]|nr:lipopolysaccharide biosynthesis protein [Clostridiales bacterium]
MDNKTDIKRDYLWNTIGSGIYALMSMVLAFAAMNIAGPDDGGVFSFGFSAFGQQIFIIAYFGIRPFHITDSEYEYSYSEYRRLRRFTCLAAAAAAAVFLCAMFAAGRYTWRKAAVIFLLSLYKIADGAADLYESECQRAGALWLGGKELTFRTLSAGGSLILVLLLTKDVLTASAAAVLVQTGWIVFFRSRIAGLISEQGKGMGAFRLAGSTVLLFLSVFLDFYIFSASKYAIDLHMTDADSGIFNILFMPTSVIYLAANFIIRPFMTRLSSVYESGDLDSFEKTVRSLTLAVGAMGAAAAIGAALLGRFCLGILELILGAGYEGLLTENSNAFFLIILGGGFYAAACLFYYVLVIMRRQKLLFVIYLIAAAAAFGMTDIFVVNYGLMGAAAAYPVYMCIISVLFAAGSRICLRKERQKRTFGE